MYMFYGGINYKLRGQRSCVQTHSCPTEKIQQTLELNNTAIRSSHISMGRARWLAKGGMGPEDQNQPLKRRVNISY